MGLKVRGRVSQRLIDEVERALLEKKLDPQRRVAPENRHAVLSSIGVEGGLANR